MARPSENKVIKINTNPIITMTEEIEMLTKQIKTLEVENRELRDILGIRESVHEFENVSLGFESLKINPTYLELSNKNHTIYETWIQGEFNPTLMSVAGYKRFNTQMIDRAGTVNAWTHKSILEGNLIYQQSADHFHTVIQIAAYLIKAGFEDVVINHWNDVDVVATYGRKTYAFEYERPQTHTVDQLRKKFKAAIQNYDVVYLVCSVGNRDKVSIAVEGRKKTVKEEFSNMCTRGSQFKFFIDCIISGNPIENCHIKVNT